MRNMFQHDKLDLSFSPGVTAIVAPNGRGKSNLMRSIYLLYAGEPLGGDVGEAVKWGEDKAEIRGCFEHDGHTVEIERALKGKRERDPTGQPVGLARDVKCGHRLQLEGEQPTTRKADVNARIQSMIGMDPKALPMVAFVKQGELAGLLQMEHSKRAAIIAEMLDLKRCEKGRDALLEVSRLVLSYPDRRVERQTALDELDKAGAELSLTRSLLDKVERAQSALEPVRSMAEEALRLPLAADVAAKTEEKARLRAKTLDALDGALACLANLPDPVPVSLADMGGLDRWTKGEVAKGRLSLFKADCLRYAKAYPRKPAVERADPNVLAELRAKAKAAKDDLALIQTGACPTCKRPFELSPLDFTNHEDYAKDSMDEYEFAMDKAVKADELWNKYLAAYKPTIRERDRLRSMHRDMRRDIDAIPEDFDADAVSRKVQEARKAEGCKAERAKLEKDITGLRYIIAGADKDIERLRETRTIDPDKRDAAEKVLSQHADNVRLLGVYKVDIARLDAVADGHKRTIDRIDAEEKTRALGAKATAAIEGARTILHPDRLPRLVARSAMSMVNNKMEEYLQSFAAPFSCRLNDDMDFVVTFGGVESPVTVLSGGQTVVAALAFRLAMLDVRAFNCGILVLDEPTAYLDEANIEALLDVLAGIDEHVRARGLVVLVPTHEPSVINVCSGVIKL